MFDTTSGYFSCNPLGLWRLTFPRFTDLALNSDEGKAKLDELRERNGADKDGTPIIKRLSEIDELDVGPSRFYRIAVWNAKTDNSAKDPQMTLIANDGNLLPKPFALESVQIGVAERVDVVIDFSKAKIGDELYLVIL